MAEILVLANETIGGATLLDAIRERARAGRRALPRRRPADPPAHGNVIYDEAVRDSAQVRVDLALSFMRAGGHRRRRRGRRRRPAQRRHGRDRRPPDRRDHRLDAARQVLGLDEARPDRGAGGRDRAAGQPRRGRPRARRPAVRRDAGRRQPDGRGRRARRAGWRSSPARARAASSSSCRRTTATGARSRRRASGCGSCSTRSRRRGSWPRA